MIYVLWHGGPSYSTSSIENGDLESFPSIRAAKCALMERWESGGGSTCLVRYANKPHERSLFPAVTTDSAMDVFMYDPREAGDPSPDFRLFFGPRLGVRRENY